MKSLRLLATLATLALLGVTLSGVGCSPRPSTLPSEPPERSSTPVARHDSSQIAPEPLRIGVQAPLTGPFAYEGATLMRAVRLMASNLNRAAGGSGLQVEIFEENDAGSPAEAPAAARRLVARRVAAVVGSYPSPATAAVQRIYADAGILHLTPASPASELTDRGIPTFFRLAPDIEAVARLAAARLVGGHRGRGPVRIAVVYEDSADARDLAARVREAVAAGGGEIVHQASLGENGTSPQGFGALLARIREAAPEAIFLAGPYRQAGRLLADMRYEGPDLLPVVTGSGSVAHLLPEQNAPSAPTPPPRLRLVSAPVPGAAPANGTAIIEAQEFGEQYHERYGEVPATPTALLAADALQLVVQASRQTGSTTGSVLARFLRQTRTDVPGLSGPIRFMAGGDRQDPPLVVYRFGPGGVLTPALN